MAKPQCVNASDSHYHLFWAADNNGLRRINEECSDIAARRGGAASTPSNSGDLFVVRAVGIEPTLLAEPDFESGASTSSTTPAGMRFSPAAPCHTRRASSRKTRLVRRKVRPSSNRVSSMLRVKLDQSSVEIIVSNGADYERRTSKTAGDLCNRTCALNG